MSAAELRKCLAAATGATATAVSAGLLSGNTGHWVSGVLAVVTTASVYLIPNAPPVK